MFMKEGRKKRKKDREIEKSFIYSMYKIYKKRHLIKFGCLCLGVCVRVYKICIYKEERVLMYKADNIIERIIS